MTVELDGARLIDGKATAAAVREDVRLWAERLTELGHKPGLAVVLVGDDPASRVYVLQISADAGSNDAAEAFFQSFRIL